MTDRELLELAAKAAGMPEHRLMSDSKAADGFRQWNPLDDDGDALRLAVKLGLEIYHAGDDGWFAYASYDETANNVTRYAFESHGTDPYAATRRAIVRAAAEIGR